MRWLGGCFWLLQELDISRNPLAGALGPTFTQLERLAASPAALARSQEWALGGRAALRELSVISFGADGDDGPFVPNCHPRLVSIVRCLPVLSRLAFNYETAQEIGSQGAEGIAAMVELGRQRPGLHIGHAENSNIYVGRTLGGEDLIYLEDQ